MEIVYFTLAGVVLYLVSNELLLRIERTRGSHLPHRSLVFFAIILTLSMALFSGIQYLASKADPEPAPVESLPVNKK